LEANHYNNIYINFLINYLNKDIFLIHGQTATLPLHKTGDQDDPGNYRGITLLSTLGKLFTKVLNNRLNSWAEIYNVYIDAQSRFREHMSTINNILSSVWPH